MFMFEPGETVVYRHHVCQVAELLENYFEGKDYIRLDALFENSLKLFVAQENAVVPQVRYPLDAASCNALLDAFADTPLLDEDALLQDASTPTLAERRMKEEYERRLKASGLDELVPIVKTIARHAELRESAGRRLTATDKKYYEIAQRLLCDEVSVSLSMPRESVDDYLSERIGLASKIS